MSTNSANTVLIEPSILLDQIKPLDPEHHGCPQQGADKFNMSC